MKPEDIKVCRILCKLSPEFKVAFEEGRVDYVSTTPFSVQAVIRREDGYYIHPTYDTSEPWDLLSKINHSPWRTDFENMPKDGTKFLAVSRAGVMLEVAFDEKRRHKEWQGICWLVKMAGTSCSAYLGVSDFICWMPIPNYSMFLEGDE